MNWKKSAEELYRAPRPEHFTNANHCCECAEYEETLLNAEVQSVEV